MKEEGLEKSRMGKRRDLKLRRKKKKDERKIEKWDQEDKGKEENKLGKSLVWVAVLYMKNIHL